MERFKQAEAFNLTRYKTSKGGFNFLGLLNDAPALANEASTNKPVEERIWSTIEAFWKGKVVQGRVDKNKDVLEYFSEDTEIFKKEKEAGKKIREHLLTEPVGSVFVWISPPGKEVGYEEGRLRIGIKKEKLGILVLLTYGIPLVGVNPMDCLYQFWRLMEFSSQNIGEVNTPEDLRDKIISFIPPNNKNWLDFLEGQISERLVSVNIWKVIKSGQVARENRKTKKLTTSKILNSQKNKISKVVASKDFNELVYIGASIEKSLINAGYNIESGVCGRLNLDILKDRVFMKLRRENSLGFVVDQFGNGFKISAKEILCCECPFCRRQVEAEIYDGKIHCPPEPRGCGRKIIYKK